MDAIAERSVPWLLESPDPAVRYLARRDLLRLPAGDPRLLAARREAHAGGVIAEILDAMQPEGWWVKPGPGYSPKYTSSVWAILLLAQLGARVEEDARLAIACAYMLDHTLASGGQFSTSSSGAPSATADCIQGNLAWALTELGCDDPRLDLAYDWMARTVTGEGLAPASERSAERRYFAYKSGPLFECGVNNHQPCAWGGVKVMLAFGRLPAARRTPLIERAIDAGINFLLDNHPERAGYPNGWTDHPSASWWKFGFPVFYITDILQIVEAAAGLGYGADPRLEPARELVRSKAGPDGRWLLEYSYEGKTYGNFGKKRLPNPWVTLRALRTLNLAERDAVVK